MRAAVLTVSDRSSRGERADASGPALRDALAGLGFEVTLAPPVADERAEISARIRGLAASHDLVLTTGGTGLSPRDVTPEATRDVIDREAPGFAEEMRRRSAERFPRAILSRATAGTIGRCLVLNLPGSPKGAVECLGYVGESVLHAAELLRGGDADCAAAARK